MTSPFGREGTADRLVGRSKSTEPNGQLGWTLNVTDQLVEAVQDWSEPVQFKFERLPDGRLDMWVRSLPQDGAS